MNLKNDENSGEPKKKRVNPYKGLHPYEESDNLDFYGRKDETERIYNMVKINYLTVVPGKSGVGKTSLLNAGVFPLLRQEGFLPIRLRLEYSEDEKPLQEQIRQTFNNELANHGIEVKTRGENDPAGSFSKGETLREYFDRVGHFDSSKGSKITPVLLFDQFEEFFTRGKNHRDRENLIDELYWLIGDQSPESTTESITKESKPSEKRPDFRVIISLREEYLVHLTDLRLRIASIDQILFRVIHLNGKQAREIIGMPGGFEDQNTINNILRSFYPEEAEEDEEIPDEKLEVEPVLLSLICHEVFAERETVESFTKKDRDMILARFYDSKMKEIPERKRVDVEKFVENNLLTKGGKFRTHYPLEPDHPLKEPIIQLIEKRILRKEIVWDKEHIEIIHDVLAPVIAEKRDIRLAEEKKRELWNKFKGRIYLGALVLMLIVAVILGINFRYAKKQYKFAEVNRLTAEALLEFPNDNTRAVRIVEASFEKGLPDPPARTCQVLSEIGYSSYEKPFYSAILRHDDSIYSAVFSPDGDRILTASEDGTARLWDMEGNLLNDKIKHEARVMSAVFSPDGSQVLTASWDKTAKLWSHEGKFLAEFRHNSLVSSGVFSSDGRLILTASRDGTAKLWDLKGELRPTFNHDDAVSSVMFSPDNKCILTASWDKTAKLWDLGGSLLQEFQHDGAVESAVFSPDGTYILTASWDKNAKLWGLDGKLLKEFPHDGAVESAVFSSDGSRILTASRDKSARIWDLQGNVLLNLELNETVSSAKFSNNNNYILTVLGNGTTRVYYLDNEIITDLDKHTAAVKTAVFSPDGKKFLTASNDKTAILWNGEGKSIPLPHGDILSSAVFSPDGQKILTASMDNKAKLWDQDGKHIKDLPHEGAVSSAVFSQNSKWILTVSLDGAAKLWDQDGNSLRRINSTETVSSAMFSPDGDRLLTISEIGTTKIWSLECKLMVDLTDDISATSAIFSPNGKRILIISKDGVASLWSLEGKKILDLKHKGTVSSAVFSPDNRMILTASEDGTTILWNLAGKPLAEFKHERAVKSAVFSHDSRLILTASKDGTAKLWNLEGELLANLNKHKGVVNSAVFSPDGQRILTCSDDGTAKVWLTPKPIYQWLKTAKILRLSENDRKKMGIE